MCCVSGISCRQYWKEAWNRLDFLIVVAAIIDLGVDYSYPTVFKVGGWVADIRGSAMICR